MTTMEIECIVKKNHKGELLKVIRILEEDLE